MSCERGESGTRKSRRSRRGGGPNNLKKYTARRNLLPFNTAPSLSPSPSLQPPPLSFSLEPEQKNLVRPSTLSLKNTPQAKSSLINLSRERRRIRPVLFTPPNNATYNNYNSDELTKETTCPLVKDAEIFTDLANILKSMKDTKFINSAEKGYHTKYRWSFYEPFGIPPYSKTGQCLLDNYRILFKRFNYRDKVRSFFRGNPSNNFLDGFFETEPDSCVFNIFNESSSKYRQGPQPYSLFLLINYKQPSLIKDATNYKIHFLVDESYAVYVLMKAMNIMHNRNKKRGIVRQLVGKIILNFRSSKFGQIGKKIPERSRNTVLPTVVIYTATDSAEELKEILEEMLEAFPEHEEIGLMDFGVANKIAYGNIRLNKLICYAQGDRLMKLTEKQRNPKYIKQIPNWVTNMISKCKMSQEDINKRSQTFFGINFCDEMYSQLSEDCSIEPVCYFSLNKSCLDPNTIKGVQGIESTTEFSTALTTTSGGGKTRRKTRR